MRDLLVEWVTQVQPEMVSILVTILETEVVLLQETNGLAHLQLRGNTAAVNRTSLLQGQDSSRRYQTVNH